MSFEDWDQDKGIWETYWTYLEGISLDFDSSWTPGSEVRIYGKPGFNGDEAHLYSIHDCPRSLAWDTSTLLNSLWNNLCVDYKRCDGGPSRTCIITEHGEVDDLMQNAEYRCWVAQLEMKKELGFGTSIVRFTVRKRYEYDGALFFKLSVVIENINRDEWNKLLGYAENGRPDPIVDNVPVAWRGSERVIEQMPKSPWQDDRSDVTNNIRHVAHESMALVFNYYAAQSEAIERGLSLDDFQWESPSHHERHVVRPPSSQTDTPLRALRLDIDIMSTYVYSHFNGYVRFYISSIELTMISMMRSPSLPNNLSSCTLRLDPPYASLANATIPNHSSQIIEIPTDPQSNERVITTNGLTQTITVNVVQVMAPVAGDIFAGHIYGGNNGGRNNTNNITTPTPGTPSRRKGSVFLLRRFELLPGLRGIFRTMKQGKAAQGHESANDI